MSIMELNGGSVVAMAGKNCVAIGCDLRLGEQFQTLATNFEKVFPVTDRLYVGLPGLATDILTLRERLRFRVNMYTMKEEREIEPQAFAHLVSSTLYERRFGPYYIEPVIAGLTSGPNPQPFIACMDLIGCLTLPGDFVVGGTASDRLFGVAESLWQPDLEPEDLFETISQTLLSAVDRDAYSGSGAIIHIMWAFKAPMNQFYEVEIVALWMFSNDIPTSLITIMPNTNEKIPMDSDISDTSLQTPDDAQMVDPIQADSSANSRPPTSGPAFFELRRKQWRAPLPNTSSTPKPTAESTSHARLEAVVCSPGYEYDDVIWETYLKNVNERLKGGITLRKPLPLWLVIRVLRAGWMRDGTWFGPTPPPPGPPVMLETSSAMTETPALTPTSFLSEISGTPIINGAPSGRVYASRRVRTPGWNEAALEVEQIMQSVEADIK
ncbi:20S proteasome subunit beta [Ceratobasidium theobromae]|uniref:20S proteasome subunit beta n=1 Tax=Ceratobasidium theobromae TaxID=1582974 RepID=A0A5N5QUW6_9AGAM|nr:20S proteasome subunit beta [Ceratobasidium theobromae]